MKIIDFLANNVAMIVDKISVVGITCEDGIWKITVAYSSNTQTVISYDSEEEARDSYKNLIEYLKEQ